MAWSTSSLSNVEVNGILAQDRVLAVSAELNQQCAALFEQVETFLQGLRRAA